MCTGGTPDSQTEFVELLCSDHKKPVDQSPTKKLPLANRFALGYTYEDVLDADQEGTFTPAGVFRMAE